MQPNGLIGRLLSRTNAAAQPKR